MMSSLRFTLEKIRWEDWEGRLVVTLPLSSRSGTYTDPDNRRSIIVRVVAYSSLRHPVYARDSRYYRDE